jgi:uncharacterized membrane protein
MTRYEFIDRLRAALNGRIPTAQVTDTINYYEEYIVTEIRKGRTEEDVLASLGDPRLIAKTIIQTCPYAYETADETEYQNYQNNGDTGYGYDTTDYGYGTTGNVNGRVKHTKLPGWLVTVLVILIFVLVIAIVYKVLYYFAPLIIVMAAVIFMVKLFRDWLN